MSLVIETYCWHKFLYNLHINAPNNNNYTFDVYYGFLIADDQIATNLAACHAQESPLSSSEPNFPSTSRAKKTTVDKRSPAGINIKNMYRSTAHSEQNHKLHAQGNKGNT